MAPKTSTMTPQIRHVPAAADRVSLLAKQALIRGYDGKVERYRTLF